MKKLFVLSIFLLVSFFAFGQSVTIDSIGLDTAGNTIILMTSIDTLENGVIIRQEEVGLKKELKRINKNRVAAINREIDNIKDRTKALKAIRKELNNAFDLEEEEK